MSKNKQHKPIRYDKKPSVQPKSIVPVKPVNGATPMGIVAGKATLVFSAADTLFFKESRPMESMGELQSVFPPSVRTLSGAIRSFIGETQGVNWHDYATNPAHPLRQWIGYSDDLGGLRFQGAWLALDGKRLYPAPLHLLKKDQTIYRLALDSKPIWCDIGRHVRLPKLPKDEARGGKPLENTWITHAGLKTVLEGKTPDEAELISAKTLFSRESRLGIARDNRTRSVIEGLLYQTEHIRPKADLTIELDVSGLPDDLPNRTMLRLGGEGRMAEMIFQQKSHTLPLCKPGTQLALYLLTPLNMPDGFCLGFTREERDHQTVWVGELNGIALELHGAVTGKALREGGWDMAHNRPRPVVSMVPAGSVFFCITAANPQSVLAALHNQHIGNNTEYGYGHLAVGLWNDNPQ